MLARRSGRRPGAAPRRSGRAIVVEGQKLSVETFIDRKVYSVASDPQSTFGTLSDVLTVIPSVDVDPDGIVSHADDKLQCLQRNALEQRTEGEHDEGERPESRIR